MNKNSDEQNLEYFGKFLIENFKDIPLDIVNSLLDGSPSFKAIQGLQNKLVQLDEKTKDLIRACITRASIVAITSFLDEISQIDTYERKDIEILLNGKSVFDRTDEELGWYLVGDDGWDACFSRYPSMGKIYEKYK